MTFRSYSAKINTSVCSSIVAPHQGDNKDNEEPIHTRLGQTAIRKPQRLEVVNTVEESSKNAKLTPKLKLKVSAPRRSRGGKQHATAPSASIRLKASDQRRLKTPGHTKGRRGTNTSVAASPHIPGRLGTRKTKAKHERTRATGAAGTFEASATQHHSQSSVLYTARKRSRESVEKDVEDTDSHDDDEDNTTRFRPLKAKKRRLMGDVARTRVGRPTSCRSTARDKKANPVEELLPTNEREDHEVSFSRRADQLRAEISRHHSKLWCAFCPWSANVDNRGWPKGKWSRVQDSPGRHMKNCRHLVASKYYRRKLASKKYNTHDKVVAAALKEDRKVVVAIQCPNNEAYAKRLSRVGLEHADILRTLERRAMLYKVSHCKCCPYPHWSRFRPEP
ncbi:hypothetical protein C8Q79DRAFT_200665 [Trametes meyenii]|nr:hypothetical protein C8Q79DRAFT_200665 [Trametes meyenii]